MTSDVSLIERKQRRARQRIVAAAEELFAARGFDPVSVNDIAERAEVGRTTYFRYFGDKQEVVFAREQELLERISDEHVEGPGPERSTVTEALVALEPVFLRLCEHMTGDAEGYRSHLQLIDDHVELQDRNAAKMRLVARRFTDLLVKQGWAAPTATFAAEIALACFWTGSQASSDPADIVNATREAFRQALELGTSNRFQAARLAELPER